MLLRLLMEVLRRRKRRVLLAILALSLGSALAASLFTLSANISERMSRELRAYGANIVVSAKAEGAPAPSSKPLLDEAELYKLKTIFWRNNILGFAPSLSLVAKTAAGRPVAVTGTWFEREVVFPEGAQVRTSFQGTSSNPAATRFLTGVRSIAPWWSVSGDWVTDSDREGALIGSELARQLDLAPGQTLSIESGGRQRELRIRGVLRTGGVEENQVFVNLPLAQELLGVEKGVDQVLVSALATPKSKLAPELRDKRPEEMTPKEYETWYCTPLVDSIAYQIGEALPEAQARVARQVSEAEGRFANKIELLLLLVTLVALAGSALAVMTTMTTSVLERRREIGLMRAIGAHERQIALIFLAEASLIGLAGAVAGYLGGLEVARMTARAVFTTGISPSLSGALFTLGLSLAVALLGALLPVRSAMRIQPVMLLKGN